MIFTDTPGISLAHEVGDTVNLVIGTVFHENAKLVGVDKKAGAVLIQGTSTGGRPKAYPLAGISWLYPLDFISPSPLRPVDTLVVSS